MKSNYDFSQAERGKFHRPDARLSPPVHLSPEIVDILDRTAKSRGVTLEELVNELLRKEIAEMEAAE